MIDLKKMLEAGVHFGHKTSRWSPKMRPFIWGAKNRVHLIDVSKTAFLLERAGKFLKEVASTGGKFLLVGTKKPAQSIIQKTANTVHMPFVVHRWVGGTLSNYDQVKKAVTRLLHMRDVLQKSTTHYKKKEISMIQKEVARLEKNVGGIIDLDYPPAAIIIVDVTKERSAVKEASRLGIPVVALVDTNADPEGVTFVIPGNDDSPKSITFIFDFLTEQIKEGVSTYEATLAKTRAAELEARKAQVKAVTEAKELHAKMERKAHVQPTKAPEKHETHEAKHHDEKIEKPKIEHVKTEHTKVEKTEKIEVKPRTPKVAEPEHKKAANVETKKAAEPEHKEIKKVARPTAAAKQPEKKTTAKKE